MQSGKCHIYQVFTRLFGNTQTHNHSWGTLKQNGVGKFSDFTPCALEQIKALGITHIWYTGVLHHATPTDYQRFGITNDHPAIVKGRAGSPYAIKDYNSVDPDLADNPAQRNQEFSQLIERTHQARLKVIIDIVPNHVARCYQGLNNPQHVVDFGHNDDTSVAYQRDNNFYYLPDEAFQLPEFPTRYRPSGGEAHSQLSVPFKEEPAKWTGNGAARAQPSFDDWFETVKINYGIKPDGSQDFTPLDDAFRHRSYAQHLAFWDKQSLPDSWYKFADIVCHWLAQGVDGFRFDMAEMVPVEFWSYLNSLIKTQRADTVLIAEIYQPDRYEDYIGLGKMDYLYNKVGLYDLLRSIVQGTASTSQIGALEWQQRKMAAHFVNFLENHDEQRIASPAFAGDAKRACPAMLVACTLSPAAMLIYFGQEVGEPANENAGFGQPSRTSIFDYVGVPHHQRWMNQGRFDGGLLNHNELELRQFYQRLLNLTLQSPAMQGDYHDLYAANYAQFDELQHRLFAFARSAPSQIVIIAVNFDHQHSKRINLSLPQTLVKHWPQNSDGLSLYDHLNDVRYPLNLNHDGAYVSVEFTPLFCGYLELIKEPA